MFLISKNPTQRVDLLTARCAELTGEVEGLKSALDLMAAPAAPPRSGRSSSSAAGADGAAAPFAGVVAEQGVALLKARQVRAFVLF